MSLNKYYIYDSPRIQNLLNGINFGTRSIRVTCHSGRLFFVLIQNKCSHYNENKCSFFEVRRYALDHYVGKEVEIVYLDRQGNVTQRRIIIRSIRDGIVNATCLYESKSLETISH